ncbi:LamG-like jellyroll fold domain-containing protein [Synechococcus sp. GEYO]|uniref:LamG-like jellyroll fold domain-containing protein n=1 Tax=Synechococcus sp. GEYO TaxID=2575511 RepID=UPI001A7E10B3|nr:LamG-like jellyroll fold domain-containing protein [Synechococcus sp. GEYO]
MPEDTALSAGLFGKYAYFSGEHDSESYEYIRVSDDSVLEALQGEGTISAWLFRDVEEQDSDWRNVYDIPNSHLLEFSPSGGFDWRAENGHQDFFNVNGPKLGLNEWVHVAVTMSEDDDGGYVPSIYVNGDLTEESTNWQIGEQGNENGLHTTTDDLYLGILWSQNGEDGKRGNPDPWKGGIDEFKVWKSSLSQLEVKTLFAGESDVRKEDLLIHFDFENVSDGQVVDIGGHNVIGEVVGDVAFLGEPALPPVTDNFLLKLDNALVDSLSGDAVEYVAVLGSQAERAGDYRLDITAESLSEVHNLEAVEVTIQLDPKLFESINLSDVQISSQLPIQNAIQIDNESGTVTLSGASLANLGQGSMINGEEALASINLNFDNEYLETVAYNEVTGELELSPISFQMSVGDEEAVFSRNFTDSTGQLNRDIQSLAELNGDVALNSDRVSLIKEIVRMEEESGLTLGTQRTIGVKGEFTNLVREGATLEATTEWRNTGNTTVNGLEVQGIENENARLLDAHFSEGKDYLASGRFINGDWNAEAAGSTEITAKVEVTGKAGNVLDLSEGILGVSTETSEEVFENEEGSKNLITYQGDLNYDGRVSFKDLAYLNAGAARQELVDKVDASGKEATNEFGSVEQVATKESYASDVDANYDGKVSIADLSVLEKDWGKSLHTGDESFLGSGEKLDFESIDGDGTWDNSSFKRENAVAAEQIAEAQEAAGAVTEAVDEGVGGGLSDSPVELKEDDGLLGAEL